MEASGWVCYERVRCLSRGGFPIRHPLDSVLSSSREILVHDTGISSVVSRVSKCTSTWEGTEVGIQLQEDQLYIRNLLYNIGEHNP